MFKWGSLGRGYYMRAKVKAALAQMASTKSPAQNSEPVRGTLTKPEPAPAPTRVVVETRMHRVSRLQPTSALAHKPEPAMVGYYHHVYTESDNEPRIAAFYRVRLGGQPDRSTQRD